MARVKPIVLYAEGLAHCTQAIDFVLMYPEDPRGPELLRAAAEQARAKVREAQSIQEAQQSPHLDWTNG